jgi:hypothetical protein
MVFNATFNNISVISWWSVLSRRKPEYPEKTTDTDNLYHIMLYRVDPAGLELTTIVVIGTDFKSKYHTIMTTKAPHIGWE